MYKDRRTLRVLGFLAAKGLLIVPWVRKFPGAKLRIPDVLWVAENVEPRVFEVLPAALLHFPATFLQKDRLPDDLRRVLRQMGGPVGIQEGARGIPAKNFRQWAEWVLPDRRTKPLSAQRILTKSFRFPRDIADGIRQQAARRGLSEGRYVEMLVRKDVGI